MQRIDTSRAMLSRPASSPIATPGYFSGGVPETGDLATQLSPDWCNDIQENIAKVIETFGGTLTKGPAGDLDLVAAIKNGFKQYHGFTKSTHGFIPDVLSTYAIFLPFTAPFPGRVFAATWQNSSSEQPIDDTWSIALTLTFNGTINISENTALSAYLEGSYHIEPGGTVEVGGTITSANPPTTYRNLTHYLRFHYIPWVD